MAESIAFDPQAGYIVTASSAFVNFNDATFATYYQPIIGPVAFSLFYALKTQMRPKPVITERALQSGILAQLNSGGRQVAQAIHRLEAVGILQTYFQHDEMGDLFVYQLQPTLTPHQFIDDNLLSILLLEEVGEQEFKRLTGQVSQYSLASANVKLKNISHHFFDEFNISSQSVTNTPQVIKQARNDLPIEHVPIIKADLHDDFDWQALNDLLGNQPVVKEDIENERELILVEHQLYGIDEPTMKKLILRSIDLRNNHFDAQKFKQIVATTYNIVYANRDDKVAEQVKNDSSLETNKKISANDRKLIDSVKGYSPIEFLQVLKGQTGGYVTSGERHILTNLVENGKLPSDTINILTWYVIAERGMATLSKNFVDAIANNWIRNNVTNAEAALSQLKNHGDQTSNKKKATRRRKNWRKTINEAMPEWSKKDSKELNKKASAKTIANLKEQIAKMDK